jgi:hypothetical protein
MIMPQMGIHWNLIRNVKNYEYRKEASRAFLDVNANWRAKNQPRKDAETRV